ncbi:right-handed parallel beta-helix repeat-containing protein [Actinomadura sp. K4S16]|uniref:right-handed parallel beta-helix repeat-containing protein n=1 Tax=Actinomadura sp. K4S16 TaxID=1316147 RepID=UPI0011F08601|nr:right-handed parallel beta-helix repeat-containing protein [Actinomadura sp. K4S16]
MINVRDRGAIGDGVADDSAAFQDALTAGGWIYVPPGVYLLATLPLRIPARTRLTLEPGAVLLRASPEVMLTNTPPGGSSSGGYGGPGGILVEGGLWDVNGVVRTEYSGALAFAHAEDITVRDVTVQDVPGWHAVEFNACKNTRVRDSRFMGFWHTGDRGGSEAVQFDAATSTTAYPWGGPYDETPCQDASVTGCLVGPSGTPGTQSWPRGVGSHNCGATAHSGIRVARNVFDQVTDSGVRTYKWSESLIVNNTVKASLGEGIAVRDSTYHTDVLGNQVFDSGRSGIWVNNGCSQIGIRGNTVIGSGKSEDSVHYGIRISNTCNLVQITGNRVRRRSVGPHARYGLSLTSTCDRCQRYGNYLAASGNLGAIEDVSTNVIIAATDAA